MKFKQAEQEKEGMNKELYDLFIDLIQTEINKLTLIFSAKHYFYKVGQMNYKKFFKELYKKCEEMKGCMIGYLMDRNEDIPSFTIPALNKSFENNIEPFDLMAEEEDNFVKKLDIIVNKANDVRDWNAFNYLLEKYNKIDHICCRAAAAVKDGADVLLLCEQPSKEN